MIAPGIGYATSRYKDDKHDNLYTMEPYTQLVMTLFLKMRKKSDNNNCPPKGFIL